MFSNNIWTNLPVEGIDSEGEDSAAPTASDATEDQQVALPTLNSFNEEIDDGTFTTVPITSRLTPKQRARKAKKNERLKQALMADGTPKVEDQNRNGTVERAPRRDLDQTCNTSKKPTKNQKKSDLEAAEAERQKCRYIQQRPQATLEDFVRGYQRRGRN